MFCCGKKEPRRFKRAQVSPGQNRSMSVSQIESPEKKAMFSKQSPHFGPIDITKKAIIYADDFEHKTTIHCRFCGGRSCKHENWTLCQNPAIQGLHSNWINDNIIASQRLSDRLIHEYDIIQQFKNKGVTAIFNLQEPGEHPYCGDGISTSTGFSYTPELLMNNGISFFNFFWKDLTNPSFERCLNAVQVMDFIIKNGGKVLVHCHAGQGRTALVIGACLIYSGYAKDDKEAIAQTRLNRPKCFSKGYNKQFLKFFYDKLVELRIIFPSPSKPIGLKALLDKQNLLLHGEERRFIKFIPKVLNLSLTRIRTLSDQGMTLKHSEILHILKATPNQLSSKIEHIRTRTNQSDWQAILGADDLYIALAVVVSFLQSLQTMTLSSQNLQQIVDNHDKLEGYLLGFLTAVADIVIQLTQGLKPPKEVDDVFEEFACLILQDPQFYYYKDHLVKTLKVLGKLKDQIYQEEDGKQDVEMSPIKQQIIVSTDPDAYKKEVRRRSVLEGTHIPHSSLKEERQPGPDDATASQMM